jgi:hypothetical protein
LLTKWADRNNRFINEFEPDQAYFNGKDSKDPHPLSLIPNSNFESFAGVEGFIHSISESEDDFSK